MNCFTTDKEMALLQDLAAGDEQAFKLLFDAYRNKLFYYISRLIKSDQVAEELVMDVFMKIWTGRELAANITNFDSFLFRIAHNKSVDFLRTAAYDHKLKHLLWEGIQVASNETADSSILVHEFEVKLRAAIMLLPPQRKKVYNLSREHNLSHQQIAGQLQISKATVNNHIVEAQAFIRTYLAKSIDLTILVLMFQQL